MASPNVNPDARRIKIRAVVERHRIALLIFAAAFVVRAVYLLSVEQPPVTFDARLYVAAGLAGPMALTHPGLWTDSVARAGVDFQSLVEDLTDDEKVAWFPYAPPTFDQALDQVFFTGPVYPAFLGTVFRLVPRWDFWAVRWLQALIDSASALLVFVIVRRLMSSTGGIIAAAIWVVYGPAIYKTGELNTESLSIFFGLVTLFLLLRAHDTRRSSFLVGAGLTCGLLALTKASTSALIVPLIVAWIWIGRREMRQTLGQAVRMLFGFAIIVVPWLLAVYVRYGVLSVRDPEYAGANWRTANILVSDGYNLDSAPADFWTFPVWREMKRHPTEYLQLYLRKVGRMWSRASDDFRRGFPLGYAGTKWFHRSIVLFALIGLFVLRSRAGPVAWLPLTFVGYFAGLHLVMHAISRYNLLAIPVLAGAAVVGGDYILRPDKPGVGRRITVTAAILFIAPAAIWVFRPTTWLLVPGVSTNTAILLFMLTGVVLIALSLWCLKRMILDKPSRAGVVTGLTAAILSALFLAQAVTRESHADWNVRLDDPAKRVSREIEFPDWVQAESIRGSLVCIDGAVEPKRHCEITVTIDHIESVFPDDSLVDMRFFYSKPNYLAFMAMYGDRWCDMRQWSRSPLDPADLDTMLADRKITITVAARPVTPDPGALFVYGDLPVDDYAHWVGPDFMMSSVERYYEGNDPRIWAEAPLEFKSARSVYVDRRGSRTDDLSDQFGRQTGQYRIRIALLMDDGEWRYF